MAVKARRRVPPVNIVKSDFEWCNIKRKSQTTTNALAEPVFTESTIGTNVRCAIDPMQETQRKAILPQGVTETGLYLLWTQADVDIEAGDVVVDADSKEYAVRNVVNSRTHKSALLQLDE